MKDYLGYTRLLVVTTDDLVEYDYSFGMHQTCISDFAQKRGYEYESLDHIIRQNNAIIRFDGPIDGKYNLVMYLPENVCSYQLEFLKDFVNNLDEDKLFIVAVSQKDHLNLQLLNNYRERLNERLDELTQTKLK